MNKKVYFFIHINNIDGKEMRKLNEVDDLKRINSRMFFDIFVLQNENKIYHGKLTSPIFEDEFEFYGLDEMILIMDEIMDKCNRPIRDDRFRTFGSHYIHVQKVHLKEFDDSLKRNQRLKQYSKSMDSFFVTISYRQYHSWQGNITSMTKGYSKNFRSALEFIKLIDSVIDKKI